MYEVSQCQLTCYVPPSHLRFLPLSLSRPLSMGDDQPAMVAASVPGKGGQCLFTSGYNGDMCRAKHKDTLRLCACVPAT